MTLDEAIKHAKEVASEKRYEYQECVAVHDIESAEECGICGEQHEQLAEWLKDYKRLLEQQLSDTVSRGAYEQVMWERDVAIGQLKELGYGLGQKIEPCDDAISREAALEKMADYVASGYADSAEDFEEYSRIICQLPSVTQKPIVCDDAISCEAVIEWLKAKDIIKLSSQEETARKELKALPPVTPQQKYGKWIKLYLTDTGDIEGQCSKCGFIHKFIDGHTAQYNYCPNCGRRMVEPQESEEV